MEKRKKNLQAPSLWSEYPAKIAHLEQGLELTKSVDQAYRAAAKVGNPIGIQGGHCVYMLDSHRIKRSSVITLSNEASDSLAHACGVWVCAYRTTLHNEASDCSSVAAGRVRLVIGPGRTKDLLATTNSEEMETQDRLSYQPEERQHESSLARRDDTEKDSEKDGIP
ncbi:hypothetical protein MUK42_32775 [Musa troglodytarum]|uniref:Uncharacterized protein n=1 Tax=Musa troglodytarum TaxID=320322 RepID=A0A9E7IDS8_9LILI|nr:hypothetical protein MUK42_32775 [Musa troglodytarum]